MISIFNGRSRGLGETSRREVHLQMSVRFRRYLHHFKGAQLGVFMAIALHADDKGWSWPKVSLLRAETGYEDDTLHKALKKLCELKIKGYRVLLRAKEPPAHYVADPRDKNYARNFYLIFPTPEEIARLEGDETVSEKSEVVGQTVSEKTESVFSDTEKSDTVFLSRSLNDQEEPDLKEEPLRAKAEPTHTQPRAQQQQLTLVEAEPSVCVSADLTEDDFLAYARAHSSFVNPDGWAAKHWPRRHTETEQINVKLVREWQASRTPEKLAEARAAVPDSRMTFHQAGQVVHSISTMHKREPVAVIEELAAAGSISPEVEAQLRAKFAEASPVTNTARNAT